MVPQKRYAEQHSWNLSLTNQTVEMKPPIVLSPVKTAQTGCKSAQPAAKCCSESRSAGIKQRWESLWVTMVREQSHSNV